MKSFFNYYYKNTIILKSAKVLMHAFLMKSIERYLPFLPFWPLIASAIFLPSNIVKSNEIVDRNAIMDKTLIVHVFFPTIIRKDNHDVLKMKY